MGKFTFIKNTLKINKHLDSDPQIPTLINELAFRILMLPLVIKKGRGSFFKNKYVCADASIISTCYAYNLLTENKFDDNYRHTLLIQIFLGTTGVYKITSEEYKKMWKNRIRYFEPLIANNKTSIDKLDFPPIAEEASILFSHDFYENKFVEFRKDTPIILMDFEKQYLLDHETNLYFKTVCSAIEECIHEEMKKFSKSNNNSCSNKYNNDNVGDDYEGHIFFCGRRK